MAAIYLRPKKTRTSRLVLIRLFQHNSICWEETAWEASLTLPLAVY
jgi:hypothetical protein